MINRLYLFLLLFSLTISECWGQASPNFIPPPGLSLDKGWKWQSGDNPNWARPDFNDSAWESIDPTQDLMDIPQFWKTNVGWLRIRFRVDSVTTTKSLAMLVEQNGASEIYLNGRLLGRFGEISDENGEVRAASTPIGTFLGTPIRNAGEQVLAVRFAIQKNIPYIEFVGQKNKALSLLITDSTNINFFRRNDVRAPLDYFKFGFFLLLAITHLALFYFDKSSKSNLYFFLSTVSFAGNSILLALVYYYAQSASSKMGFLIAGSLLYVIAGIFFLTAVYTIFNQRKGIIYWTLLIYWFISIILLFIQYHNSYNWGINLLGFLTMTECARVTFLSARRKQRGATIIVWGCILFIVFYSLWASILFKILPAGPAWMYGHLAFNIGYLSLPVSISIYLALEASFNSRSLAQKLVEVQQLSTEKQQILASQNETLEQQVNERTAQLNQSLTNLKTTQNQLIQKEKLASLGELTAGIAHEIQNPLNFVNNFAEVSVELADELHQSVEDEDKPLSQELAGDLRQNMQLIAQNGQRASSIVRAMLEHSSSSTGERHLTDLATLVEEYLKLAYHGFRAKHDGFTATLKTDMAMDLPMIDVVVGDMGRVLLNLFNNAFYALHQRVIGEPSAASSSGEYAPAIEVSTRKQGKQVELRVMDNGLGIPVAIQGKVFQPFFTTKPTGQGTGLGLSLSYDIITKGHGGEMWVESQEGQGTTFIMLIPIN
ncbi:sensor histidine kinase [Spirosoma sp. BT702]|uniref:histidine kinase n=1 Tax=Spirosoma profusum TaxID=2771354 RepID=A0A927AR57_9BACT|nr:sensor histidine kinase [Spirosoma profusum]MBD2701756.1 sensor histidine kinase [Spirosoma profusum]